MRGHPTFETLVEPMALFESKNRTALDHKPNGEREFDYLDRSGKPEAEQVRQFLDAAFSSWPRERQADLRARLVGGDYVSASFELILHELLKRRGRLPQIEVAKEGTTKRPDFFVGPDVPSFYLEAVVATEAPPTDVAAGKRLGQLHDLINGMADPNFFVTLDVRRYGARQPSARAIKSFLRGELKQLDPDSESIWTEDNGFLGPKMLWEHDGWSIVFHAIPKRQDARGKPGRLVGAVTKGLWVPASDRSVRAAVKAKGGRYGEMDRPYVVAVNVITDHLDEIDLLNALFGTEFYEDRGSGPFVFGRAGDGVLGNAANPRYTRVSAVAFFENVEPWNVARRRALLVHNPYAKHPLPPGTLGIAEGTYAAGPELHTRDPGTSLAALLGLSPDWPKV